MLGVDQELSFVLISFFFPSIFFGKNSLTPLFQIYFSYLFWIRFLLPIRVDFFYLFEVD